MLALLLLLSCHLPIMTKNNRQEQPKSNLKHIVVVDDDLLVLELAKIILEDTGHRVTTVKDSLLAFEKIKSCAPDLVFLDIVMPELDGEQLLARLKSKKKTADIPVVLLSASSGIEKVAREGGAQGYISKPFDIETIEKAVEKYAN